MFLPTARPAAVALVLTAALAATVAEAAPASARGKPWPGHPDRQIVTHVVRPGETATGLAVRFHAWTRELIALNRLGAAGGLRAGQRVRIPVVVSAARAARPATTSKPTPRRSGWRHWRMTRSEIRDAIGREARRLGVPVALAQAIGWQESGWHQPVRSGAGAIGVMQVLPGTGVWMSLYAGRPLDLRDTHDNITAGVTLVRVLLDQTSRTRTAVAAYYQGLGAVRRHGLYPETRQYVANVLAVRDRL
jgi:soluble lytic murein transglycosylase-like protein